MGIALERLERLRKQSVFSAGGMVLDIGSSNLYSASQGPLRDFIAAFGRTSDDVTIDRLATGAVYHGDGASPNASFVGELLEAAGLGYVSFDVANGYRTRIFDLNHDRVPPEFVGHFDVVLNFGTTEHVINQLNAFRVIHDAAKVGGFIVHEVPTGGYIDHGYFCYTPRFLFDLAGNNEYEVVDFGLNGPEPGSDIYEILRAYAAYFPVIASVLPEYRRDLRARIARRLKRKTPQISPANLSSYLVLRKTRNLPLRLPHEGSTSVHVPSDERPENNTISADRNVAK